MCLPSTRKNKKRLRPRGINPESPDEQPNYVPRSLGTVHTQDPVSWPYVPRPAVVTQGRDEVNSSDAQRGRPESRLPQFADEPKPAKAVQDNGDQSTMATADSNYYYTKQQQRRSDPDAALYAFEPAPIPPARLFSFEGYGDFYGREPNLEATYSSLKDYRQPPSPPRPSRSPGVYQRLARPAYPSRSYAPSADVYSHGRPVSGDSEGLPAGVSEVSGIALGWRFNAPNAAPKDDIERPVRIRKAA